MLRHKILLAANFSCSNCHGIFEERELIIHHISEFETKILCKHCHKKLHYGENRTRERRFYVSHEFEPTLQKLMEILKRDSKSLSQWIREHAVEYVRVHEPGNPQQTLTRILKSSKAYRAPDCSFANCKKSSVGQVVNVKSGKKFWVCMFHRKNALESGKWQPFKGEGENGVY